MNVLKSVILYFLIVVYSTISFGFSVKSHFCCGKLKSISLTVPKKCCGESNKSKGCCHDETKFLKIKDSQVKNSDSSDFLSETVAIFEPTYFFEFKSFFSYNYKVPNTKIYDPPPLNVKTPLFVKNKVFII